MKFFRVTLEFNVEENLEVFVEGLTALDAFQNALTARFELVEVFRPEGDDGDDTE